VIIVVVYAAFMPKLFGGRLDDASRFGEMFGAFNAFFGGLAFLGVVYTVWLQSEQLRTQSEELRLQREELERTRAELARAATAQERSEHALNAQLRASAISARLSAISLLIQEEVNHLTKYHASQLGENSPGSLTENQINQYISRFEAEEAAGRAGDSERCFLGNMRTLRDLKRDLQSLYNEVRTLTA
jgi:hypothetical protein